MYERASFHVEARRSARAQGAATATDRRGGRGAQPKGAEDLERPRRDAVLRDLAVYSAASASISCSSRRASTWNSLLVQPLHRRPGNPNRSIVPRTLILFLLALASPVVSPVRRTLLGGRLHDRADQIRAHPVARADAVVEHDPSRHDPPVEHRLDP